MYDQTTQHMLDNLGRWVAEVEAGRRGPEAVVAAAKALLRVTSPEAVEDREYYADLTLPADKRCGAEYGRWGRVCSRRAGHVSTSHRDLEFSWTDAMKEEARWVDWGRS